MSTTQMQLPWKVVLDTNVFIAAFLAKNPKSPNRELIQRWLRDEFVLLTSSGLIYEIIEKFNQKNISPILTLRLITDISYLANIIEIAPKDIQPFIPSDPDDNLVIACAIKGHSNYIISYDSHLLGLGKNFRRIKITEPIPFLFKLCKAKSSI